MPDGREVAEEGQERPVLLAADLVIDKVGMADVFGGLGHAADDVVFAAVLGVALLLGQRHAHLGVVLLHKERHQVCVVEEHVLRRVWGAGLGVSKAVAIRVIKEHVLCDRRICPV